MSPPTGRARFLNRELSWLDFDRRVLALAEDPDTPLLERIKFLAIFVRNLDEFFQVRVAGLQDQAAAGLGAVSADERSPAEQLQLIRRRVAELTGRASELFEKSLRPALAAEGIAFCAWSELDATEQEQLEGHYRARILPVLTPLAVDPAHPFPQISSLSLNLGVMLQPDETGAERFARVKVPPFLPRFLALDAGRLVPVERVLRANLGALFPGEEILSAGCFRVTRDADLELREEESVDLARDVETGLRRRVRGSDAVRLEYDDDLDPRAGELLAEELGLEADELFECRGLLDLGALWELHDLDRPEHKYPPWSPQPVARLDREPQRRDPAALFAELRRGDVLVHHPFETFEGSVQRFLEAAVQDPQVRVIKVALYRTGGPESGIVRALERAALAGKQVVAMIELKARFDEAANLERARALERAGAHVVYGLVGLKTHAKIALVIRDEPEGLRRYCHVATGNYNPVTARLYEDVGLLSASPELAADVAELFNQLTSASAGRHCQRLLVAPEALRGELLRRIAAQTAKGPAGRIAIKVNGLSDPRIVSALYEASQAGVPVDLVVRGICVLRPGIPGLSETVRVRSILGRFLEHSRIFRFGDGGGDGSDGSDGREYWIGSADLMLRNLDARVEVLAPVVDRALQARLEEILELCLHPRARAWSLRPDGSWEPTGGDLDVQARFQALARERAAPPPA